MTRVSSFLFLIVSSLLVACGGGSSSSPSSVGGNGPPETLDKFDISSYEPSALVETSNLTGTWLFVGSYDMEYRNLSDEDDEFTELERSFRAIVSIIDSGDTLTVYATEGRVFIDRIMASREGSNFIMALPRGTFSGEINNNTLIEGQVVSIWPDEGSGPYLTINSSSLGLVKINSTPILPNIPASRPSIGEIGYHLDFDELAEEENGGDQDLRFPIHFFWEEEGEIRHFTDGVETHENIWYELWVYSVPDEPVSIWPFDVDEVTKLRIDNIIQEEMYPDEEPLGWGISEDVILDEVGDYGFISGLQEPIITVSEVDVLSGVYSETEENVSRLDIDISIQL